MNKVIMSVTVLIVLSLTGHTEARVVSAASCSQSDVTAAHNSAADGDIVQVPAGTCGWTTTLNITKAITLAGAGIDQTIIVDNVPTRTAVLAFSTVTGRDWRLTGFTFSPGAQTQINYNGAVQGFGGSHAFRIDHIKINDLYASGIGLNDDLWGVIDHSIFFTSRGMETIRPRHDRWGGVGDYGDNSWAQPTNLGSAQAIFIEDNTFTNTGGQLNIIDSFGGARYVVRHNTFTNCNIENHGTDTTPRVRSMRTIEVYNNTWIWNLSGNSLFLNMRGGTGVVYNNVLTNGTGQVLLNGQNFRDLSAYEPWGSTCNGTGPYDQNGGQSGYACLDQVGRGQGSLVSGSTPSPIAWPNQELESVYTWNNTLNGATEATVSTTHVQVGRDIITGTPKPGYTPFVYPHPLVGELLPAPTNLSIQ